MRLFEIRLPAELRQEVQNLKEAAFAKMQQVERLFDKCVYEQPEPSMIFVSRKPLYESTKPIFTAIVKESVKQHKNELRQMAA